MDGPIYLSYPRGTEFSLERQPKHTEPYGRSARTFLTFGSPSFQTSSRAMSLTPCSALEKYGPRRDHLSRRGCAVLKTNAKNG